MIPTDEENEGNDVPDPAIEEQLLNQHSLIISTV